MNQVCAQCGAVGFHQPGCGLGQVSAPLQQAAQSSAMIQAGVGNLEAGVGGIQAGVQAGFGAVQHQLALGNVLAAASLGLQRQQLGVQVRQLGHLQSIDAAIARMANYQERQAALTQVLFELQQKGAFVTELARTDAFSAGIYGRLYVEGVTGAGITVEAFDKLEYKHEFAAVIGRLRAAWTRLRAGRTCTYPMRGKSTACSLRRSTRVPRETGKRPTPSSAESSAVNASTKT